jgi:hypothetical protein
MAAGREEAGAAGGGGGLLRRRRRREAPPAADPAHVLQDAHGLRHQHARGLLRAAPRRRGLLPAAGTRAAFPGETDFGPSKFWLCS